jgi:hypothetical protein
MLEVRLPRDIAFMVRNRLLFRKIPYKEIAIDKIGLDPEYAEVVEKIIEEVRELKKSLDN